MNYYVQYLVTNVMANETVNALGSEGVFILDGRNNMATMITDAKRRLHALRHIHNYKGFHIVKGTRFEDSNAILYEYYL